MIALNEIIEINRINGGQELNTGNLEFALSQSKGKNVYRKLALIWRAILIDHGFTDANKRTALDVSAILFTRSGIHMTEDRIERLTKQVLKVTKKTLTDARKIEYRLRYAIDGGKIGC